MEATSNVLESITVISDWSKEQVDRMIKLYQTNVLTPDTFYTRT